MWVILSLAPGVPGWRSRWSVQNDARVPGHPEVVKDETDFEGELPHLLGDAPYAFGFDHANGEPSQPGDVLRAVPGADSTPVFIVVPVEDVVTAVLDRPVAAVGREHALGIGFFGFSARHAIGDPLLVLERLPAALFVQGLPFDHEGLPHVGKVEIPVQCGRCPDLPGLDAPVIRRIVQDEVRLSSVPEEELDILVERSLILLDDEVVVGLTPDDVLGDLPLGEQGIGGDILALDVDGGKERDRALDLVGPFDLLIGYPDASYFFWV